MQIISLFKLIGLIFDIDFVKALPLAPQTVTYAMSLGWQQKQKKLAITESKSEKSLSIDGLKTQSVQQTKHHLAN